MLPVVVLGTQRPFQDPVSITHAQGTASCPPPTRAPHVCLWKPRRKGGARVSGKIFFSFLDAIVCFCSAAHGNASFFFRHAFSHFFLHFSRHLSPSGARAARACAGEMERALLRACESLENAQHGIVSFFLPSLPPSTTTTTSTPLLLSTFSHSRSHLSVHPSSPSSHHQRAETNTHKTKKQ